MKETLDSSEELDQSHFFRMFALGCLDSLITLPIAILGLVTNIIGTGPFFRFYLGWTAIHSDWEPTLFPKSVWSIVRWNVYSLNWDKWINPFWALVFFSLFGLTPEAKKGYGRLFRYLRRPFGIRQVESTKESLPKMFGHDGEANTTFTSNVSNRYGLSILTSVIQFLI